MHHVLEKQRCIPEILIRIWRFLEGKKKTAQHSHDSGTNAMPCEDKRAAPRQRWASLNSEQLFDWAKMFPEVIVWKTQECRLVFISRRVLNSDNSDNSDEKRQNTAAAE